MKNVTMNCTKSRRDKIGITTLFTYITFVNCIYIFTCVMLHVVQVQVIGKENANPGQCKKRKSVQGIMPVEMYTWLWSRLHPYILCKHQPEINVLQVRIFSLHIYLVTEAARKILRVELPMTLP